MKPAPFDYHAPETVSEALNVLRELEESDAKVLAGGQSLMPMLNMRLARPAHIVDINGIQELDFVRQPGSHVSIGALTRHRTLERSPDVAAWLPILSEVAAHIGDRQIRVRGTLGGSLIHADPAAELPTVAAALDAELVLASYRGQRLVTASDFFVGILTTAAEPDELLVEVRFPRPPQNAGLAFVELARQHGAFAIVSALAVVVPASGSTIRSARLCLGGAGGTPIRARRAEGLLVGREPSALAIAEAAQLAGTDSDPSDDVHGSADYRRAMAVVLAERALTLAAQRARWDSEESDL